MNKEKVMKQDKVLVSEDTRTWVLPKSLVNAFEIHEELTAEETLYVWWQNLRAAEDRIHEEFPPETIERLRLLLEEFEALMPDARGKLEDQAKMRDVAEAIVRTGLTTQQAALYVGVPHRMFVQFLVPNVDMDEYEYTKRVRIEELLRLGNGYDRIASLLGCGKGSASTYAKTLGIKPRQNGLSMELRNTALEMYDRGVPVKEIAETLSEQQGFTLKPMTIYKWANRYRKGV